MILSITTERLLEPGWRNGARRLLFRTLVTSSRKIRTVSIHKLSPRPELSPYITDYIVDFQYWDLNYLKTPSRPLPELSGRAKNKPILAFIGAMNEKKSRSELLAMVAGDEGPWPFTLVVAGKLNAADEKQLAGHQDVLVANRYTSDEEVMYLYEHAKMIYAYYSVDVCRPSGIFGRAIQLGRNVLVRHGGYLEASLPDYPGMVAVDDLTKLRKLDWDGIEDSHEPMDLDDSRTFIEILDRASGKR